MLLHQDESTFQKKYLLEDFFKQVEIRLEKG